MYQVWTSGRQNDFLGGGQKSENPRSGHEQMWAKLQICTRYELQAGKMTFWVGSKILRIQDQDMSKCGQNDNFVTITLVDSECCKSLNICINLNIWKPRLMSMNYKPLSAENFKITSSQNLAKYNSTSHKEEEGYVGQRVTQAMAEGKHWHWHLTLTRSQKESP